tara:strand:- start:333 stop:527 length:195 start_codon:yes stop_codon:yes gene_type:complete
MGKKHDSAMLAAWARENGLRGYEHYDPRVRAKARQEGVKQWHERKRKTEDKNKRPFHKKSWSRN